ncbi:MAG: (2Fe-2S)-binding protein [Pseudomonadota bacterium]
MIVCVCHRVTESQIASHALTGCSSFEELQHELRVATACGACHDCARSTFDAARGGCGGSCAGLHGGMRAPARSNLAGAAA